jgi:hypothetical protein
MAFDGALLLVEGGTDATALGQFVDRDQCQIVVADTKLNVITAVQTLRAEGMGGLVGLIDADFEHLLGGRLPDPDLISTPVHDLEMLLVATRALDRVLLARGSAAKLGQARMRWGPDLRAPLVKATAQVGALRLHSIRTGAGWTFEDLAFSHFVDAFTLEVNPHALCQEVKNKSQMPGINVQTMIAGLRSVLHEGHDHLQLCCGHDFIEVLRLALRKAYGTQQPSSLSTDRLGSDLALAYEETEFRASQVAADLLAWQQRNPSSVILPQRT